MQDPPNVTTSPRKTTTSPNTSPARHSPKSLSSPAKSETPSPVAKKTKAKKQNEQKPKKGRSKKDPNAPKRPLSAFMYYSQHARAGTKEANPDASFGDLGRLLGASWKELSEQDRTPFTEKAAHDKQRYDQEMETYKDKDAE